jgi:hypothetical protein
VVFMSIAPPHYPCSADIGADQTKNLAPHVGSSNIVPAATTTVEFTILGSPVSFDGIDLSPNHPYRSGILQLTNSSGW